MIDGFSDGPFNPVMVMELIEGQSLNDYLIETRGQLIPKRQLLEWQLQMADAVAYLHDECHLTHNDLHTD